jgi:hypothetical protein
VYHELVPCRPRLVLAALCFVLACAEAHWATLRWPSDRPGTPRQPVLQAAELDLAVQATAIAYEPEAITVALTLENGGASLLQIERAAITLAWDELEYAVEPRASEPAWIELAPEQAAKLQLRYHLGRPLTGPGSRLILRSLTRDGVAVLELPQLELPAMPASAR